MMKNDDWNNQMDAEDNDECLKDDEDVHLRVEESIKTVLSW